MNLLKRILFLLCLLGPDITRLFISIVNTWIKFISYLYFLKKISIKKVTLINFVRILKYYKLSLNSLF